MFQTKVKSYAKLNLALNVVGKRSSLHKIETLVAFASLHDEIFIKRIKSKEHQVQFTGKFSNKIGKNNTISKLLEVLEKKKLLKNKKYKIKINKKIPNKSGLGGGSMNAANILNFFVKKKIIKITQTETENISKLIGSDVILGLDSSNTILNSRNILKRFKNCKKFYILIVKPNFGCSTKFIYSQVKKFNKPRFNNPKKTLFSCNNLKKMSNSLEPIVLNKHKKLTNLKLFLTKLSQTLFVRMTGSGSAIVAYFQSEKACYKAQRIFKKKYKNYWCIASKTI